MSIFREEVFVSGTIPKSGPVKITVGHNVDLTESQKLEFKLILQREFRRIITFLENPYDQDELIEQIKKEFSIDFEV